MTVCFVILHYNVLEETVKCIKSILGLEQQENIYIVVVDNASPNGTGKELLQRYGEHDRIKVILREKNDGFSAGNNDGCGYAIKVCNPDFIVVANNDIEFCQKDFIQQIEQQYQQTHFDILGPDIYNPIKEIHQSPIASKPPSISAVNRTIMLNQLMLALYPIAYPFMKRYYMALEKKDSVSVYDKYQENVCIMGACMIYARKYINARNKIFEPETKFYYEENIQTLWCARNGKKIIYQPKLQVWHWEGKATQTIDIDLKKRIRFRMENVLQAAKVYKKFYLIQK